MGAELAGTGICSGEGGMLAEEQQANSRYFYELASAKFGYHEALLKKKYKPFTLKADKGLKQAQAATYLRQKKHRKNSKDAMLERRNRCYFTTDFYRFENRGRFC